MDSKGKRAKVESFWNVKPVHASLWKFPFITSEGRAFSVESTSIERSFALFSLIRAKSVDESSSFNNHGTRQSAIRGFSATSINQVESRSRRKCVVIDDVEKLPCWP
jgi:hypothetical protein